MDRETLAKIRDLLSDYDLLTKILSREYRGVTVEGYNRDYEGHVCDTVRWSMDFEDVKPFIEKEREELKQKLKSLDFKVAE